MPHATTAKTVITSDTRHMGPVKRSMGPPGAPNVPGYLSSELPPRVEVDEHDDRAVGHGDGGELYPAESHAEGRIVGSDGGVERSRQADVDPEHVVVGKGQKEHADAETCECGQHGSGPGAHSFSTAHKSICRRGADRGAMEREDRYL